MNVMFTSFYVKARHTSTKISFPVPVSYFSVSKRVRKKLAHIEVYTIDDLLTTPSVNIPQEIQGLLVELRTRLIISFEQFRKSKKRWRKHCRFNEKEIATLLVLEAYRPLIKKHKFNPVCDELSRTQFSNRAKLQVLLAA